MRVLFSVIENTIREGLRKRFLAGLLAACILILCLSLLFAQLSLDDKGRLTVDFGLAAVQILLVALTIFFSSSFIGADLEKKILWTILTRPVHPAGFFFGRWIGLAVLLFIALLAGSFLLVSFFVFLKIPVQLILFYALIGFFFESLLLLSFVFLFCSYSSSFLTAFYCLSVFIIGHFAASLLYFINKSEGIFKIVFENFLSFLPNLEKVNWKSAVVYQERLAFSEFASSSLYILLWAGLILSLALFIMENREYE